MADNSTQTQQPDLSVIILTYNVRDLTHNCLQTVEEAVRASKYAIETIVVDNASTDDTVLVLQREFPDVRLIVNETNLGFARGNNVGLAAACGRYFLLLNSDTEVEPGAFDALIAFMDSHLDAGACGPMLLNADGSLQPSGRPLPSLWSVFTGMTKLYRLWKSDFYYQKGRDYTIPARVGEVSGAAMLVRRDVYERLGGFDPNLFIYYEDIDWCKRIGEAGYSIYYVPAAKIKHLWQRITRVISEKAYRSSQNSLRYYFMKHHGQAAQQMIQALLLVKELALIVANAVRGDQKRRRFHQEMLANVFSPLPGESVKGTDR